MGQGHSKSSLFLIEMIIIILFLAIASALCVQVFVGSHIKSREAQELSRAEELAGGAANIIRGSYDEEEVELLTYYPEGVPTGEGVCLYYDGSWKPCDPESSAYRMEIGLSEKDGQRLSRIRVLDDAQREIYTLRTETHIRFVAGAENGGY